jgi:transcription antitermination factor NusG
MKSINPDLHWYVCTFRPRKALDAMHAIRKAGFDVYLPRARIERWSKRGHCYTLEELPALPPYIFVGFVPGESHFDRVRKLERETLIGNFLGVRGTPEELPAEIVEAIHIMETEMKFDDTPQSRAKKAGELDDEFPVGMAVQFIADLESVLADMQGEVLGTNGRDKVHVRFGMMKSWLDRKEVRAA